jgi:hypothetical protein
MQRSQHFRFSRKNFARTSFRPRRGHSERPIPQRKYAFSRGPGPACLHRVSSRSVYGVNGSAKATERFYRMTAYISQFWLRPKSDFLTRLQTSAYSKLNIRVGYYWFKCAGEYADDNGLEQVESARIAWRAAIRHRGLRLIIHNGRPWSREDIASVASCTRNWFSW